MILFDFTSGSVLDSVTLDIMESSVVCRESAVRGKIKDFVSVLDTVTFCERLIG